jgi:peptide/nickel transport system ATP-binding protein/oligopeptide transport system ATP-binding protein
METLLSISNLTVRFETGRGPLNAVDGIDLELPPGETMGLVGESGCGKSVTALAVMGLVPRPPGRIDDGRVLFAGENLLGLPESRLRRIRGNRISMIFQEPMTSLNPVFRVGEQIAEVFRTHRGMDRHAAQTASVEMLEKVGIPDPRRRIREYPHQMSGGMRQRVMIAMALSCNPQLLIADEPTTALDVTIQAQILELMNALKTDFQTAVLLITHDLGVVAETAQQVAVMYAGRIVEQAEVTVLFQSPMHPYTVGLLASIPNIDSPIPADRRLKTIPGTVPSLVEPKPGCAFADRCEHVYSRCTAETPALYRVGETHTSRCFLHDNR